MLDQSSVNNLKQLSKYTNWGHNNVDRFPAAPGSYEFLSNAEKERSRQYCKFKYLINEIGCRGNLELKKSIGFFGCSFTFGEGVPEENIFPYLVAKNLGMPFNNLGCNGFTIPQIAHLFHASLQILNFDIAVITLPSPYRFHYVTSKGQYWPVYPNKDRDDEEHEKIRKKVYPHLSSNYLLHQAKDYIIYMQTCADLYNKKIVWGTWCKDTYLLLENLQCNPIKFEFEYQESLKLQGNNIARDNMHPGIEQHSNYSEDIIHRIK